MLFEESLKYRYKGIIRKFLIRFFFLIEIISKIEKKYKINSLVLSGWNNNIIKNLSKIIIFVRKF